MQALHLAGKAQAYLLQLLPDGAAQLAYGRKVDYSTVTDVCQPLQKAAHVAGGVHPINARHDRGAAHQREDLLLPHLLHDGVGIPNRKVPGNAGNPIHTVSPGIIYDNQIGAVFFLHTSHQPVSGSGCQHSPALVDAPAQSGQPPVRV